MLTTFTKGGDGGEKSKPLILLKERRGVCWLMPQLTDKVPAPTMPTMYTLSPVMAYTDPQLDNRQAAPTLSRFFLQHLLEVMMMIMKMP